jgi:alanyl-tRNA synthetase
MRSGTLHPRDLVTAEVDAETRDATRRNHTATHLLHAALREVLGSHVKQAGSLVAPDRLRFDFVHFAAVTRDEQSRIERIVNEQIVRNVPVQTNERSTAEAIAGGAVALFGEKYGERVRVVSVPGFSTELCGGTHCRATGDIGTFVIVGESGVAAGVRRIEAVTGAVAVARNQTDRMVLQRLLAALGAPPDRAVEAVERLQGEVKRLTKEASQLRVSTAMGAAPAAGEEAVDVAGIRVITRRVDGFDKDGLRRLADSLRDRLRSGVVVIAAGIDGKVSVIVSVSADLTTRLHAGQIVKQIAPIVGGGGGGRADFAEAGGRDATRIDEMLAESRRVIATLLG